MLLNYYHKVHHLPLYLCNANFKGKSVILNLLIGVHSDS